MLDERIKTALERDASQISPPPDLLARIEGEALRPSLWRRLGLLPKLEIAVACLLVAGLIGTAAYRQLHRAPLPAEAEPVIEPWESVPPSPLPERYSGEASDGALRAEVVLIKGEKGDWMVYSTFQNLTSAPLEVRGGCYLTNFEHRTTPIHSCKVQRLELAAGLTVRDAYLLPTREVALPLTGLVEYTVLSEGPSDRSGSLAVPLQLNQRSQDSSDLITLLRNAGLSARYEEELGSPLFGARRLQQLTVEGENVLVYLFDGALSATHAWRTMTDAGENTVSWATEPQFVQLGNLIIQVDGRKRISSRLQVAIASQMALQPPGPPPLLTAPSSASLEGPQIERPKLGTEVIARVMEMLQAATLLVEAETPPPPSSGPNPPPTLQLELVGGEAIRVRSAADCQLIISTEGPPPPQFCQETRDQIFLFREGKMSRYRAPALAAWLAGGWREDLR